MIKNVSFNMADIEHAMIYHLGYCIECGSVQERCEPDTRDYKCDMCDANAVYGAEELVLMGHVVTEEKGECHVS